MSLIAVLGFVRCTITETPDFYNMNEILVMRYTKDSTNVVIVNNRVFAPTQKIIMQATLLCKDTH